MPIENRNLKPGTKLVATYKKETYHAEMIAGEAGKVLYRLEDGGAFKSPSSAGTAITSKACNGWKFWSVDTGAAPDGNPETGVASTGERAESENALTEAEESPEPGEPEQTYVPLEEEPLETPVATFRRVPNQRGITDGEVRLYCDTCQASFTTPKGQPAETCPEGHYPSEG